MKSCVRALAVTLLLAILVVSLVPGAFRPHTMIFPSGFEHVIAMQSPGSSLAWPAIIACRRCCLFCCDGGQIVLLCGFSQIAFGLVEIAGRILRFQMQQGELVK